MVAPAAAIEALAVLRDHALQPHQTGVAEQVRADLALLEVAQEDTVHTPRQQPCEAGLAHRQRQAAEILAIAHQDVEGVELDLGTSRTKEELRLRSGWPPRWLRRGVSRFAGLHGDGAHPRRGFAARMEAASDKGGEREAKKLMELHR